MAFGMEDGWVPFTGSLVEIVDLEMPVRCKIARLPDVKGDRADFTELGPEMLDGKVGICLDVYEDVCRIKTFENVIAEIPKENLRDYYPSDSLDGGFDLVWPADGAVSLALTSAITEVLSLKGYCVMQMFLNEGDAKDMVEDADTMPRQYRMKREIESAYLGMETTTKVALRPHDTPSTAVTDAMSSCDRFLTFITVKLGALPTEEVGFRVKSRTNTFVRTPYKNDYERSELAPESLAVLEGAENWDNDVKGFIKFSRTRTISMLHMVQNEGGNVYLYPRDTANQSIKIPISSNKLLLFRHDWLDYSYQPLGKSLALQAWIHKDNSEEKAIKTVELDFEKNMAILNPGRALPEGIPAHILALHAFMPIEVENEWHWWAEFVGGTDGCSQWPADRWDTDLYYLEGDEAMSIGKSYTKHGGFVTAEQINCFDSEFFGIDKREATFMIPGMRWTCQTGYAILRKAGWDKKSLDGAPIGTWIGDVGPDWHSGQNFWTYHFPEAEANEMGMLVHSAITNSRLAFIYNMRGPTSSYDTACSASLVAMNAAHTFMMNDDDKMYGNMALVMGWNTLLWPVSYIGNCAAGMLSHAGRCWTFNRTADGYQRGEGSGGVFLQRDCTDEQIKNREGAIIGTATNQDGRSASITAPNGPSQTAVIKKSMAFAGIDVNTVGMAECHGTGTALGDPIEVGALQAVMRSRIEPILKVSTKSHIGHLEAGAGIAGLTKCLQMIRFSTSPPNAHFNCINPNLMVDGYPVLFTNEVTDTSYSSGYCGVSSFGFGGTNSRCDVYNTADRGPRKTVRVQLPTPALPLRLFDEDGIVSICGTWNGFGSETMESDGQGAHIFMVTLGETRVERFYLRAGTGDEEDMQIYPGVNMAGQDEQVFGPDANQNGRCWVIDGREDGMPTGTIYGVTFEHGSRGKSISWTPVGMSTEAPTDNHLMYISGSFNYDSMQPMVPVPDVPGTYEVKFQIGPRNKEEFQLFFDKDPEQVFYPGAGLSVCGPDGSGNDAKFHVGGLQFQVATVRVTVRAGAATVSTYSDRQGYRTWGDMDKFSLTESQSYFLVTSADNFQGFVPMVASPENPGIFKAELKLSRSFGAGDGAYESFQVCMNKDVSKMLFPSVTGALCGPELETQGRCWTVTGNFAETYEVTLNINALNRASMIDWNLV